MRVCLPRFGFVFCGISTGVRCSVVLRPSDPAPAWWRNCVAPNMYCNHCFDDFVAGQSRSRVSRGKRKEGASFIRLFGLLLVAYVPESHSIYGQVFGM